jgi:hypothetical protein
MRNDNKKSSQLPKNDASTDQPQPTKDGQSGAQAGNPAMKHKTGTPEDLARLDDDGGMKKPPRD